MATSDDSCERSGANLENPSTTIPAESSLLDADMDGRASSANARASGVRPKSATCLNRFPPVRHAHGESRVAVRVDPQHRLIERAATHGLLVAADDYRLNYRRPHPPRPPGSASAAAIADAIGGCRRPLLTSRGQLLPPRSTLCSWIMTMCAALARFAWRLNRGGCTQLFIACVPSPLRRGRQTSSQLRRCKRPECASARWSGQ